MPTLQTIYSSHTYPSSATSFPSLQNIYTCDTTLLTASRTVSIRTPTPHSPRVCPSHFAHQNPPLAPPGATPQSRADPAPAANGSATANSGRNPLGQRLQTLRLQRAEAVVRERDASGRGLGAGPSASSLARRAARGGGYQALESVCGGEDAEAEFAAGLVPHEV